jgi:hypothetical protein
MSSASSADKIPAWRTGLSPPPPKRQAKATSVAFEAKKREEEAARKEVVAKKKKDEGDLDAIHSLIAAGPFYVEGVGEVERTPEGQKEPKGSGSGPKKRDSVTGKPIVRDFYDSDASQSSGQHREGETHHVLPPSYKEKKRAADGEHAEATPAKASASSHDLAGSASGSARVRQPYEAPPPAWHLGPSIHAPMRVEQRYVQNLDAGEIPIITVKEEPKGSGSGYDADTDPTLVVLSNACRC